MESLNIFIRSIFIDNMVFAFFFGMCSYIAVSKNVKTALGLGLAVTFVMVMTVPLNYLLYEYVLKADVLVPGVDLSFLTFIVFIATIAAFVQLVEMAVEKFSPTLYNQLGIFLPLIAVNCAILGGSLFMQQKVDALEITSLWQSIVYGLASGLMLAGVISWFSVFHEVMTSDKFMYLFGKVIPAFSLLLSMTLRFVPRFTGQIKRVAEAQQCIGRNVNNGNIFPRAAHGLKILSITTTWALENSVETAESKKSRAYGLRGRTNFSIYRFDRRDGMLLAFLLGVFGTLLFCMHLRKLKLLYFPVFIMN